MIKMYRWISSHKRLCIVLLIATPFIIELMINGADRLLKSVDIQFNPLGLNFSDRYAFIGALLGGSATLMAV